MHNAVGGSDYVWIAKSSQGYKWFASEAVPQIDAVVGRGTKILINLGVNDVANVNAYAELVNKKRRSGHKRVQLFIMRLLILWKMGSI